MRLIYMQTSMDVEVYPGMVRVLIEGDVSEVGL